MNAVNDFTFLSFFLSFFLTKNQPGKPALPPFDFCKTSTQRPDWSAEDTCYSNVKSQYWDDLPGKAKIPTNRMHMLNMTAIITVHLL